MSVIYERRPPRCDGLQSYEVILTNDAYNRLNEIYRQYGELLNLINVIYIDAGFEEVPPKTCTSPIETAKWKLGRLKEKGDRYDSALQHFNALKSIFEETAKDKQEVK